MSIDVNVQNDLVIVTESSEDITVNVSNAAGPAGVGVPVGGTTGQVLKKLSNTNYDTYWALDGGGVPYSGATGDVDLGEFELKAGQVEFDQTPTGAAGVAVMRWNDSDGTVDLGLKGGNVTLQVGQEQILRVVNKTGANLLESQYRAVRIRLAAEGGSQGQRLAVVLAQGNNDTNSTDTIGIVTENITDNQEGFICTSGIVRGINTTGSLQGETWADGDVIYLSPTIPGAITKVKPTAPDHSVVLGYVIYAHNVNGKIFVKCETGYEIGELHDVYAPTPSNNDGIFWNTANSRYQNNSIAGVLGYTPISGSGVTGQVAYWNGTNSQTGSNNLFWDAANSRLGIGTNTPASLYKLDVVGAIRASTFLWSPAFYAPSDLFFGISGGTSAMRITTNRNVQIFDGSTPADGGQRLQVQGDAFIKGSGATGATTALQIQNSSGGNLFSVNNYGTTTIRGTTAFDGDNSLNVTNNANTSIFNVWNSGIVFVNSVGGSARFNIGSRSLYDTGSTFEISGNIVNNILNGGDGGFSTNFIRNGTFAGTGGNTNHVNITANFATSAAGATFYNSLRLNPTINQTGSATGITRGLLISPTLTAAADWRSIEWSNNSGWGLYGAGTANNYLGGSLGIGSTTLTGYNLRISKDISGASGFYGLSIDGLINPSVTSFYASFFSRPSFQTTTFNLSTLLHFGAYRGNISGGATVTDQYGFLASGELIGATNNYGFFGSLPNGTGNWNLYMNGTADNYLRGKLLINTTTVGTFNLDVNGTARVSGASRFNDALTNSIGGFVHSSSSTTNDAFYTLLSGAVRFIVNANGYCKSTSNIVSDTNGVTSLNASAILQVDSTTKGFLPPRMTNAQRTAISSPAVGLIVYCTDMVEGLYVYKSTGWTFVI